MHNTLDVCVLGRIGYDLYAVEHNRPLAEVQHFSRQLGGSSANTAVGLARLSLKVGLIGCIGNDLLADYLLQFLGSEKVDTKCVRRVDGFNTSLCLTEVSPPDKFPQVFYRTNPADMQVTLGSAEQAYIQSAKMFITNGTSLAAPPARESTIDALKTARAAGLRTVFDIDYRPSSWTSPEEAGRLAQSVLPWVDVVLGNEEELAILTGNSDCKTQVSAVLTVGTKLLVRKLGPKGVEAYTGVESCSAPPWPTQVTCAIGAGDGFAAGFLYALYQGQPLSECLTYGNAAAAVVVSRIACADSMPRLEELHEMVDPAASAAAGLGQRRD
jgi:5-dehydro-2-deoxygluconokinase